MAFIQSQIEQVRQKQKEINRLTKELEYELALLQRAITIHKKEDHA